MTMLVPEREQAGSVHYDPQKLGRLNKPVIVLRKVNVKKLQRRETRDASTPWELIGRAQVQLHLREDALPWYEQALIVNDQPRDEKVNRDIEKATIGFAVARSDTGEVIATYGPDGLAEAEETAASVRLSIKPQIEKIVKPVDDDEDLINDWVKQNPAAEADEATQEA